MSSIPGTVINSRIVPTDTLDNYATHDAQFGRDGWRSVTDLTERDSILSSRRVEGMPVWVQSVSAAYQLVGGVNNSNWIRLSLNGDITKSEVAAISAGLYQDIINLDIDLQSQILINENSINSIFSTYTNSATTQAISAGLNSRLATNEALDVTQTNSINTLFSTYTNSATTQAISAGLQSQIGGINAQVASISGYTQANTNGLNTLFSTYTNSATTQAISAGLNSRLATNEALDVTQTNSINTLFSTYTNSATTQAISAGLQSQIDSINIVGGTNVTVNQNGKTWTVSSIGGGGGGNSWLPAQGTGMSITAPTTSSYLFSVSDYISGTQVAAISAGLQSQISSLSSTTPVITGYTLLTTTTAISAGLNSRLTTNEALDVTQTNSINTLFSTYTNSTTTQAISAGLNSRLTTNEALDVTQTNSINTLFSTYTNSTTTAAISAGLQSQINSISGVGIIGVAEDGSYLDGLFVDFIPTTPVGTAVDRFNEVLKALAPSPAPALTQISINQTGVAGYLSFGPSHTIANYTNVPTLDINSLVSTSQVITDGVDSVTLKGIFNATTTFTGTLASNVATGPGTPTPAYPANSFNNGNSGQVQLWLNGNLIASADLTSTSSAISVVNASGSLVLSAASPVSFPNGTTFTVFTYRTGTWQINPAAQISGYNKLKIVRIDGSSTTTNIFGWIVDNSVVATTYAGEVISGLSMLGSNYISGINYNTSGTASYAISASNERRNTYASGNAISHAATRCTVPSIALPTTISESQVDLISQVATISTASRILNQSITVNTTVNRTIQGNVASTGVSNYALLLDATSATATSTVENFDDEVFRIASNLNTTTTTGYTSIGGSPSDWDKTISLVSATAGYSDGLLQENSTLKYPTQGTNGGNYSTIANGPANPNYSTSSGNRKYLRFFYDSSPRQNFKLAITGTNINFVSVVSGPSANNLTLEVLAPNTTTDGVSLGVWKDATIAYTNDNSVGCYAASNGATIPTNWGMTLGGKNTATAGNVVVIRITASSAWVGSIDAITMTWL